MGGRPSLDITTVRAPKMADLVAADLRRRIIRGELVEGEALPPEAELTEQFGVSRPTLREAFRVLESESLIVIRRGASGGGRVQRPTAEVAARYTALLLQVRGATLEDVYEARMQLEPPAARLLAEKGSKKAHASLRAAVAEEAEAIDDAAASATCSARVHQLIVELSGNKTLVFLSTMLIEITEGHLVSRVSEPDLALERRRRAEGLKAHGHLLGLIEARDGEGAASYWRTHMLAASKLLLSGIGPKTVVDLLDP